MGKFLIGLLIGLIALPLGAYIYIRLGYAPVATTSPPLPFEQWYAQTALHSRVAADMRKESAIPADEANFLAGAHLYRDQCAVCHGLPKHPKTAIAQGMFPKPPQLFEGHGVTDDPVGETYWKVANGIRLTGMPGFTNTLSETQMWQISQLLAHADKLPPSLKPVLEQ